MRIDKFATAVLTLALIASPMAAYAKGDHHELGGRGASVVGGNPTVAGEVATDQDILDGMAKPHKGLLAKWLGTDQVGKHQTGMQGLKGNTTVPSKG